MSLLRPRVRDDRGRPVLLAGLPYHTGPNPLKHLGWRRAWPFHVLGVFCTAAAIPVLWLAFKAIPALHGPAGYEFIDRFMVAGMAAFVGMLAIIPIHQQIVVRRWGRPTFLAAGLCPSCRFELSGLAPEPDGCTVCPECGAAWRLGEGGAERRSDEATEGGA